MTFYFFFLNFFVCFVFCLFVCLFVCFERRSKSLTIINIQSRCGIKNYSKLHGEDFGSTEQQNGQDFQTGHTSQSCDVFTCDTEGWAYESCCRV